MTSKPFYYKTKNNIVFYSVYFSDLKYKEVYEYLQTVLWSLNIDEIQKSIMDDALTEIHRDRRRNKPLPINADQGYFFEAVVKAGTQYQYMYKSHYSGIKWYGDHGIRAWYGHKGSDLILYVDDRPLTIECKFFLDSTYYNHIHMKNILSSDIFITTELLKPRDLIKARVSVMECGKPKSKDLYDILMWVETTLSNHMTHELDDILRSAILRKYPDRITLVND